MSNDNVQALPPGTRLGDYRLDAVIGHGGFGITYRAFDTQLTKFVAVKEYLPVEFAVRHGEQQVVPRSARFADDFAWGRDRFLDEARALARFRHPHIVPVLRYFEANDTAYTVMEFEDGKNLGELFRAAPRGLPIDDIYRLAAGLLSGLGAVHAQGFLHRDIKPSNIIIRRDGVPVLIDFGAARLAIGARTRTFTSVLTPQYAPIEQYALDGKQGPWSDIYSAAAVLYQAIIGKPPPDAAARAGIDPYLPLADTEHDRYGRTFLAAIDRALAFAPADRPQSVAQWSNLFGDSLRRAEDAPTVKLATRPDEGAPRLGGVSRELHLGDASAYGPHSRDPVPQGRSPRARLWILVAAIIIAGAALWHFQPEVQALLAGASSTDSQAPVVTPPTSAPTPAPFSTPQPSPPQLTPPQPTPQQPTPQQPTVAPQPSAAQQALIEQARRAAVQARSALERAEEAARAARSMAGEARIVAARAAQPDLANAERRSFDAGASYIGQLVGDKRQGLGVADLANGERQAGEWNADRLNGLGTVRFADGTRYEGQWRDGLPTGLGVREKPDVERAEGNFVAGRLEGMGVRRTLGNPAVVQSGAFQADLLEGPGVEVTAGERYEGGFRAGKRSGYGQVTSADGKVHSGRWQNGKLVETTP